MNSFRYVRIVMAMAMILTLAMPMSAEAAKPPDNPPQDITATPYGQQLAAEAAQRFTSYGVPTETSNLLVKQYDSGRILVVPTVLATTLTNTTSPNGQVTSSLDVGASSSKGDAVTSTDEQSGTSALATTAAAYWQLNEQACLASLYVDSARLDSCYYIFQLINDGSTTKNFWTLRQKGTAFEYGAGLHSAWVSGERTPNTASQTWVDWAPEQGHDGACSSVNVGVSYIASLSYSVTACEKWIFNKTCNTCSPWIKNTWDCNCWFGLNAKNGVPSRAVAYQMLVSTSQSATPRFRLGLGMAA
jgi:hypothetical protein